MLKNYFKLAFRNLFRNSLFSFINIFGLALSMSVALLVLMRIKDRLDYDRFHTHTNRMYRVITQLTNKNGNAFRFATTPLPLSPTLSTDYDVADAIVRLYPTGTQTVAAGKRTFQMRSAFTEPAFFNVFGFMLQQGDALSALQEPNSIVLSRETALKFFGNMDAINQVIRFEQWGDFRVTGILGEPKGKSHIGFEAYISMASVPTLEKTGKFPRSLDQWSNATAGYTYVRVKEYVTKQQLTHTLAQIAGSLMKTSNLTGRESISFEAQPFRKIILGEELINDLGDTGSRGKTWAEAIIALIILLMACFNYTNLSITRSLKRGKEIGVRKISGAIRAQVFAQFIIESMLTALLSLALAYVLLKLMMDYAPFAQEMVPTGASVDMRLWIWFVLFSLFTGLLAGALPAWALSAFKPVDVLKNLNTIKLFGGNRFRKVLTATQFTLSLFIIVFTVIVSNQFHYLATADPGFRRDNLLNISLKGTNYEVLSNAIVRLNGVNQVSASSVLPGEFGNDHCAVKQQTQSEPVQMDYCDADSGFINNMGLKLLAGSSFHTAAVHEQEQYVVLNEKAVQALQIKTPADAIDQLLWIDTMQVRVAGVINDFYARGLDLPVAPLVLRNRSSHFNYLHVHMTAMGENKALIAAIEKIWKTNNPHQSFEYSWLKDELYQRTSAWSTVSLLGFLALIAVTIACLGLLGMVMYTTETRKKEIGIRKVMGAGVSAIMVMLSKGFLKLVIIAGAIALPLSYAAGRLFLNIFANRITITAAMLAGSFTGLLLLVLLTIGIRIYQIAIANPVDSLRTE